MTFSVTQIQFQTDAYENACHLGMITADDTTEENETVLSWVYDCGSQNQAQKVNQILENKHLNYVFVSHFDGDHINGITSLKVDKNTSFVLPYISKDIFLYCFLMGYSKYTSDGLLFMKVLFRRLYNIDDNFDFEDDINKGEYKYYNKLIFNNFVKICKDNSCTVIHPFKFWEFIPYSYQDSVVNKSIVENCLLCASSKFWKKNFRNIDDLCQYVIFGKNVSKRLNSYRIFVKHIYDIFSILFLGRKTDLQNLISMSVYAGPTGHAIKEDENNNLKNTGWSHTGDACLYSPKVCTDFFHFFGSYFSQTNVLSLPHHGSRKTNEKKVLSSFFSNSRTPVIVIPYSKKIRHCCHKNAFCQKVYCTYNQDIVFKNGVMKAIPGTFPCNNQNCNVYR